LFAPTEHLADVPHIAAELRSLVQAFLDARAFILPQPRRPHISTITNEESQESQYDYLELDIADLTALDAVWDKADNTAGPQGEPNSNIPGSDRVAAQVMNDIICPAMYRFVCKRLNVASSGMGVLEQQETDAWIDCWVGSANVVVGNKYRVGCFVMTIEIRISRIAM
jgi:hypothetical protein